MPEIKCPNCGEVFQVNETGYEKIVRQVRDKEFAQELDRREKEAEVKRGQEFELLRLQEEKEHAENMAKKDAEISAKEQLIAELQAKVAASETARKLAVSEAVAAKNDEIAQKNSEIANLKGELKNKETENLLNEKSMKEQYEGRLKLKDEQIEYYKDFKAEVTYISPGNLDSSLCFFQPSVCHDVLCIEVK